MIAQLLAQAGVWQRLMENAFYQHALVGGVLIALLCSVLSVFVVLKRMAFIGEGIAHAAFGGVGAALLAGLLLEWLRPPAARDGIVTLSCVATALTIGALSRRGKLGEDATIGICLVGAMALGLILIDIRAGLLAGMIERGLVQRGQVGYTPSLHEILFGSILFIRPAEIWIVAVLAVVVLTAVLAGFKELVFFTFDEETAGVFGVRTTFIYYALLVAIALAVVTAVRSVGVILASALLVLPGASARFWFDRIALVTLASAIIGVVGMATGIILSIWLRDFSPGAVIVLTYIVLFAISLAARSVRQRLARARSTPDDLQDTAQGR